MRTWKKRLSVIAYLVAIPAILACQSDPVGPTTSNEGGLRPDAERPGIHKDADEALVKRVEKARAQAPRFLTR